MSIHLYKHNEDAYRAVETMLEESRWQLSSIRPARASR